MARKSTVHRGLLVAGVVVVWIIAFVWVLGTKGELHGLGTDDGVPLDQTEEAPPTKSRATNLVSEIVLDSDPPTPERTRGGTPAPVIEALVPVEPELDIPRYPVWFESERDIGVCRISYEGGNKTANLHVAARFPAGPIEFTYRCGKESGRGSLEVKPNRVNGVLFCSRSGKVSVKTVRSKDARCGH